MLICLFKMVVRPMGIYYAAVSALVCVSANFCNKMLVEGNGMDCSVDAMVSKETKGIHKKKPVGTFQ